MIPGYTSNPRPTDNNFGDKILAPTCYRTQAREGLGEDYYQYTGEGGLSWAIPYAAGVLAMGWQVNPDLTNDEIFNILRKTAYVNNYGSKIINPVAFIEAIEKGTDIEPNDPKSSSGGGCNVGYGLVVLVLAGCVTSKYRKMKV